MRLRWTKADIAKLHRDYPHRQTCLIAAEIGRTPSSVYQRARIEGLTKSADFLTSVHSGRLRDGQGAAYRFKPGHAAWNKGMKGLDIGGKATRFHAGNRPQTWRPIGSERTDKDGILWRKLTDTRRKSDWKAVHVIELEKMNGPLPRGKFVVFADGNRSNFDHGNLLAVTRAENMQRNTVQRYPTEVRRLIQLRGALNRQINKRANHVQQD